MDIRTSAPGRICLFGEHQDYLKMPVIPAAIDRIVELEGHSINEKKIIIHMPDIGSYLEFEISGNELNYDKKRDYFKSIYNHFIRRGAVFNSGFELTVRGNIPINSGTSSSSALNNAFAGFLLAGAENLSELTFSSKEEIGKLTYYAEVEEFGEPGGRMDQYSTAKGGVLYLDFSNPDPDYVQLPTISKTFVLGDSKEPKDTLGILSRLRNGFSDAAKLVNKSISFDLNSFTGEFNHLKKYLNSDLWSIFSGGIMNRDILREAKVIMEKNFDDYEFGKLLYKHHEVLRDNLNISTKKIEKMLNSALDAGALGGKINGSGGGGCMFAYAPNNPEAVKEAIEREGGKAYIINIGDGLKVYKNDSQIL
ncbi:MAG: GHMP kinase [Candidatus Delongbacteria bacterium]|nr:GHMP kinase [Candidatus Delongbacteria bacterium]MBN2836532.1 GHMP kinase [Candidatus Delongbacteria bacterium]